MTENEKQMISSYASIRANSSGYEAEDLQAYIEAHYDATFAAAVEAEYKKIMANL
ncbi:hypothetical protein AGMMS49991_02600 [Spirochaetia bacterium]|nr:hypothetical protein AGMMS49991_02600 [Spirochaetia bacterium]